MEVIAFAFFASLGGYNFVKYGIEAKKHIIQGGLKRTIIGILSIFSILVAVYLLSNMGGETWLLIGILVLLTGLYALPVLPGGKNLRSLGLLKVLLLTLVWSGFAVLLPNVAQDHPLTNDVWIVWLQNILLVFILFIPFEIRDMGEDDPSIKTLPQRLGVWRTVRLGYLALFLLLGLTFFSDYLDNAKLFGIGILALLLFIVLRLTRTSKGPYYASFWVEGIPIFWWLLWTKLFPPVSGNVLAFLS